MSDFKFNAPTLETVKGSEEGSTYLVFAKASNLKLSVRAFLMPIKGADAVWLALGVRLRAETTDGSSCSEGMATDVFGQFGFYESGYHSSAVMALPLVGLPCSPAEFYGAYAGQGDVAANLVNQIAERFYKTVKFTVKKEDLIFILQEKFADLIPQSAPTVNTDPQFQYITLKAKD